MPFIITAIAVLSDCIQVSDGCLTYDNLVSDRPTDAETILSGKASKKVREIQSDDGENEYEVMDWEGEDGMSVDNTFVDKRKSGGSDTENTKVTPDGQERDGSETNGQKENTSGKKKKKKRNKNHSGSGRSRGQPMSDFNNNKIVNIMLARLDDDKFSFDELYKLRDMKDKDFLQVLADKAGTGSQQRADGDDVRKDIKDLQELAKNGDIDDLHELHSTSAGRPANVKPLHEGRSKGKKTKAFNQRPGPEPRPASSLLRTVKNEGDRQYMADVMSQWNVQDQSEVCVTQIVC